MKRCALICLTIVVLSTACSPAAQTATPVPVATTAVPTALPTLTITPTATATPTNTSTATPFPTAAAIEPALPDILINISPGLDIIDCVEGGKMKILYAQHPYNEFEEILADNTYNYSLPRWSPSGTQFAYIQTEFTEETMDEYEFIYAKGTDTIWLYDLTTKEKRPIGDPLPRFDVRRHGHCSIINQFIGTEPIWSPDGRYVAYGFQFRYPDNDREHYVADVTTGKSSLVLSNKGSYFLWTADSNQLLLTTEQENGISVYEFIDPASGQPDMQLVDAIPLPIDGSWIPHYQLLDENNNLLVILQDEEQNRSVWRVDWSSKTWKELGSTEQYYFDVFDEVIISIDKGKLSALDSNFSLLYTDEIVGENEPSLFPNYRSFQDKNKNTFLSFVGHHDSSIWIRPFWAINQAFQPQIILRDYLKKHDERYHIIDYFWSPTIRE